jgi:hypothetical protein
MAARRPRLSSHYPQSGERVSSYIPPGPFNTRLIDSDSNDEYALIPLWVAALSASALLAQTVTTYAFKSCRSEEGSDAYGEEERSSAGIVKRNGGAVVFSFMLARLFGCAALVALWSPPLSRLASGARPWDFAGVGRVQESMLAANVSSIPLRRVILVSSFSLGVCAPPRFRCHHFSALEERLDSPQHHRFAFRTGALLV